MMYVQNIIDGSRGRIRTYDQSVNPDDVGTLPLSYVFISIDALGLNERISSFLFGARVA
jgi:hypothetical protein